MKTAIKIIWNIKFLYLKSIFITVLIIISSFLVGLVIYALSPIAENLLADASILVTDFMWASIFAHLFKHKVLNKLDLATIQLKRIK